MRKPWFRKSDGWWYFHDDNRKAHRLSQNKRDAFEAWHKIELAADDSSPLARFDAVADSFLEWTAAHRSPKTYEWYVRALTAVCEGLGGTPIRQLKKHQVRSWVDGTGAGAATRRSYLTAIKRVITWAVDEGLLDRDPIGKLERPATERREVIVPAVDYARIVAAADRGNASQYRRGAFRAFLVALRHSGARPGEISGVTAAEFVPEAGVWLLANHKTKRKTGRDRVIYLSPCLVTLSRILAAARPTGPLFLNSEGKPWTTNAIRCRMRNIRKALDLPAGTVAYAFRHTFATEGLLNGVEEHVMAELLGHTSTAMLTKHYSHLGQRAQRIRLAATKAALGDSSSADA